MKANELRIGNYISVGYDIQVIEIMCDCVNTMSHEGLPLDAIEPIPLTEEWLVKFGFKESPGETFSITGYEKGSFNLLRYEKEKDFNGYWLKWYYSPKRINIIYVHTLQNLYFALTGEELTIK